MNSPRSKTMAWMAAALLALFCVVGLGATPARAGAGRFSQVSDVPAMAFLPAANLCTGETLSYTGNMHVVSHLTLDSNGGYHMHVSMNAQGVTATSASGETYNLPYSSQLTLNDHVGTEQMIVTNMRLTGGQGGFSLHSLFHLTVNADGTVTSSFSGVTLDCE